jgi:hypothetical protein
VSDAQLLDLISHKLAESFESDFATYLEPQRAQTVEVNVSNALGALHLLMKNSVLNVLLQFVAVA